MEKFLSTCVSPTTSMHQMRNTRMALVRHVSALNWDMNNVPIVDDSEVLEALRALTNHITFKRSNKSFSDVYSDIDMTLATLPRSERLKSTKIVKRDTFSVTCMIHWLFTGTYITSSSMYNITLLPPTFVRMSYSFPEGCDVLEEYWKTKFPCQWLYIVRRMQSDVMYLIGFAKNGMRISTVRQWLTDMHALIINVLRSKMFETDVVDFYSMLYSAESVLNKPTYANDNLPHSMWVTLEVGCDSSGVFVPILDGIVITSKDIRLGTKTPTFLVRTAEGIVNDVGNV